MLMKQRAWDFRVLPYEDAFLSMTLKAAKVLPYTNIDPGFSLFSLSTKDLSLILNISTTLFTESTHFPGGARPVANWLGMQPSGPIPPRKNFLSPLL